MSYWDFFRQYCYEFAKLRVMRAIRASVVNVFSCQRANAPKVSQLRATVLINLPTCKSAKGVPVIQLGVPACQHAKNGTSFSTSPAKMRTDFSIFQFFNFINQKPLISFSMKHVRSTKQFFR